MKKALFLLCLFAFSIGAFAQQNPAAECVQWKNLTLNATSLDETLKILGKPDKDKIEKAEFDKSSTVDAGKIINLRRLSYKKNEGYREVSLLFLNEKLFSIEFTPEKKKMPAADLGQNFRSEFLFVGALPKRMIFADYEGQKETSVPKVYPANYHMLSVTRGCAIVAEIDNNSWKGLWRDAVNKPTAEKFPGSVKTIRIFTRETQVK